MRELSIELKKQNLFFLVDEKDYIFKYTITTKSGKILFSSDYNLNINLNNINKLEIQNIIDK